MGLGYTLRDNDWVKLRQIIQKLSSLNLGPESTPTFAGITLTGPFLAADGSAAAPSYSFSADTNTGFYRPAADQIGISTGGVLRATFSDTGLAIGSATAHDPTLTFASDGADGTIFWEDVGDYFQISADTDIDGFLVADGLYIGGAPFINFGGDNGLILTGGAYEWSIGGNLEYSFSATEFNLQTNNLTTTGDGSFDELTITNATQNYKFTGSSVGALAFAGLSANDTFRLGLYNATDGGTENTVIDVYGYGTTADETDRHRLTFGWFQADGKYSIRTNAQGAVAAEDLEIRASTRTNQILLGVDGITSFQAGDVYLHYDLWSIYDNQVIKFGAGADLSIYSDGDSGVITPLVSVKIGDGTANYTAISSTGDIDLYGTANKIQNWAGDFTIKSAGTLCLESVTEVVKTGGTRTNCFSSLLGSIGGGDQFVSWQVQDATDTLQLTRSNVAITKYEILMPVDILGEVEAGGATTKVKLTSIGGYAIKLTNKTGGNTVVGQLVIASAGTDDAFDTAAADDENVIGIVLDAGIADGSEAWVVVSGIADVLIDAGGSAHGDRVIASNTAGSADVWNVGGAVATHFLEIGHCLETRVGAGLARCVLHFN